jgi:hypothetical protein
MIQYENDLKYKKTAALVIRIVLADTFGIYSIEISVG